MIKTTKTSHRQSFFQYFWPIILIWAVVGLGYLAKTPANLRAHDIAAHEQFTHFLADHHHLPTTSSETYESWQPPLYYLLISPLAANTPAHTTYVRLFSWLLGLIFLALVSLALTELGVSSIPRLLTLVFLLTTPKFVFYFTTYNNDALVGTLAAAIIVLVWRLRQRWRPNEAILLWLLAAAAVNTKLTVVVLFAALFVILLRDIRIGKPNQKAIAQKLCVIGITALLTILPWMVFHNLPASGSLLPTPFAGMPTTMHFYDRPISILKPPLLTPHQWDDPFLYDMPLEAYQGKGQNLWSALFATSIYGEYIWSAPPLWLFWALDFLHLVIIILALLAWRHNRLTKAAFALFGLAVLFFIPYPLSAPWIPNMDWRYIAWAWLPVTVLLAAALKEQFTKPLIPRLLIAVLLFVAVVLHLSVLFTGQSCCW